MSTIKKDTALTVSEFAALAIVVAVNNDAAMAEWQAEQLQTCPADIVNSLIDKGYLTKDGKLQPFAEPLVNRIVSGRLPKFDQLVKNLSNSALLKLVLAIFYRLSYRAVRGDTGANVIRTAIANKITDGLPIDADKFLEQYEN